MATDLVFLTGATGFIGSHVADALSSSGYRLRILARQGAAKPAPDVEVVSGDLRYPGLFARALDGCRYVVHCAALYSFAPHDRPEMRRVNVDGTAGLLAAARLAGIERAVLTSSSSTMHQDAQNGDSHRSSYHASKILQERAALSSRVPVVAILPTAPIGPRDHKPTPTGKMVLDFIRGKMFARPPGDGGMNLVAVEDVARAHVAALQRGRIGERYVVGGENLSFDRIWELLAALSGRAVPRWHVPYALALGVAQLDELRCRLDSGARPFAPPEGVRLSRTRMFADSTMAENELGHRPTPIDAALERAIAWYRDNGYAN